MDTRSITLTNLETGELLQTDYKLSDNKFMPKGHKMYNAGVEFLVDKLSKEEFKATMQLFSTDTINPFNILTKPFHKLTSTMPKSSRSRFKSKLLDNQIMQECNGKFMLSPRIFIPRGTKDIRNCNYLTLCVWKYLFEDLNAVSDEVIQHAELMFGKLPTTDSLLVGSDKHTKLVPKPN